MPIFHTPSPTFLRAPEKGGWIALGFDKRVIDLLKKEGGIYFISWSQNYSNYEQFWHDVKFFCHDGMGTTDFKPELIPVKIEGPWDPHGLQGGFVPYSPFKDDEEVRAFINAWYARSQEIVPSYPLYMWLARKA
jgi:hypothetical protein